MSVSAAELTAKKCTACEGNTPAFTTRSKSPNTCGLFLGGSSRTTAR